MRAALPVGLSLRGGVFQFRRRWPVALREIGAPAFLRLSLRTHVLAEAMTRAEALIAAMQRVEAHVMSACVSRLVQPEDVKAIVDETMREAIEAMLRDEAAAVPRSAAEADAALAQADATVAARRAALRLRDFAAAATPARAAAEALGMDGAAADSPTVARSVMGALIQMAEAARTVEAGATVEEATRAIRDERFAGLPVDSLPRPVMLTAAVGRSVADAVSTDMAAKQRGTGRLLLAFRGDMPASTAFAETHLIDWMMWLRRAPRDWAVGHGKNRHNADARDIDLHALIAEADAHDDAVRAEIAARADLNAREQRRIVASRLTKRMSDATIEKHHGRAKAVHDAARALGWAGGDWRSVIKPWSRQAARDDNRAADPLSMRVTLNKKRTAWTDERIAALATSSLFTGCFSIHRRWRPGRFVVRDALYWVPLLVMTCGLRPEEALQLLKGHVLFRDGVLCLHIEKIPDSRLKNTDSERWVPLPEVMLQLGFLEWWRAQCGKPGEALFPEVPARAKPFQVAST